MLLIELQSGGLSSLLIGSFDHIMDLRVPTDVGFHVTGAAPITGTAPVCAIRLLRMGIIVS